MKEIQRLMEKGNEFLGTKIPIISGAMTWISDERLVRAVNAAGAFGVLAGGNMRTEELEQKINDLKETETRFGVNLITISTSLLIQEFLFEGEELPIFIAGGIVSGRMILHLLLMGAS